MENSEVSTVWRCCREPAASPPVRFTWTRGTACSQVLGRVFTVNNTSHLRLGDNAFLENSTSQAISPEFPLRSDTLSEGGQGNRRRVPAQDARVAGRSRGSVRGPREVRSPQLSPLMLLNSGC